jgi:prepilin-type N-terminal cleavage/methylation domain-containing protein
MKKPAPKLNKTKILRFLSFNNSSGLSLIEVLIALALAALLFVSAEMVWETDRDKLETTASFIEQATSFSSSETVLKKSILRIQFRLDGKTQEILCESGPSGEFVLPSMLGGSDSNSDQYDASTAASDDFKLSLQEKERRDQALKNLDGKFQKILEFREDNFELPQGIKILGLATSSRKNLIQDSNASIYFFPSGEKDDALILLSSSTEMLALTLTPFSDKIKKEYHTYVSKDKEALISEMEELSKTLFEKWKKTRD